MYKMYQMLKCATIPSLDFVIISFLKWLPSMSSKTQELLIESNIITMAKGPESTMFLMKSITLKL